MFVPLHCHSHYSLLDGLSKPEQIAEVCVENEYKACALTDHGSISGAVAFMQACKEKGVKPILGCELYIPSLTAKLQEESNRKLNHLVVLAKNKAGWKNLIEIVSRTNDEDVFYYRPRIDLEILKEMVKGDLVSFSGHPGSDLFEILFKPNSPYETKSPSLYLHSDVKLRAKKKALELQEIFGKNNFFIEIQMICADESPKVRLAADILREVSKETGIPCVATCDAHYPRKSDAIDQRVLLCSALKTTFREVNKMMAAGKDVPLGGFFKSESFEIPTLERMQKHNTEDELKNTLLINDMCEDYDILGKPRLPHFDCPDGLSEAEYVRQLCRDGWKGRFNGRNIDANQYSNRVKSELDVISSANLDGYFLIVQDYCNWARKNGILVGPGRGSGAGCLVSYLLGITMIDPIPFDLLFSRFYNAGRNTADRVSLPDIDCDFPIKKRGHIIDYIKSKYGNDKVAQMVTFMRMQGADAISQVLRVHDACSNKIAKNITKNIPDEAEINDKLEASGETSVLRWVLEYEPERLSDWCRLNDSGEIVGEYAEYFKQAIRIEGTYKGIGKHAAGVVISADVLDEACPMVRTTKGEKLAGMDMNDLEAMGHVKFDILGVAALDKLMDVNSLLLKGVTDHE